jgi:YVTN family beta-propeller protein
MFGKQRAESVDNADGKFSGLEVCKKGGFHMRSLRALRIVGIGLAFAVILASGGLPGGSQTGQEGQPLPMIAFSYADSKVSYLEVGADGKIVNRVDISVPKGPSGLDIHGQFTYVVSWDASALAVLDNKAHKLIKTVDLGFGVNPYAVAFRPDGQVAYTLNGGTRNITVIDAINHAVLTNIALPGARSPRGLDFHPDGKLAYVSDTETDTVWVIDAVNHRVQETLRTGGQCGAYVKASNTGQWVFIADRCLSRVYALSTVTKKFYVIQLSGDSGAWYIVFTPSDWVAFVSQTDPRRQISSGKISIIEVAQLKEIGVIDVRLRAATVAALKGGQEEEEFKPGSLDLLPLPAEAEGELLLVVSSLHVTPLLKIVPLDIDIAQDRSVSVNVGSGIPVDTGMTRPTGMFPDCGCTRVDFVVDAPSIPVEVSRVSNTYTVKVKVPFTWILTCEAGTSNRCYDYSSVGIEPVFEGIAMAPPYSVKVFRCEGECGGVTAKETVIEREMKGTSSAESLKGAVIVSLSAGVCSGRHNIVISVDSTKEGNIDRENSDWDGDGVLNKDDKCPLKHRGPKPVRLQGEPLTDYERRLRQWESGCPPGF